jgi:hypothetical protein
MNRLRIMLISAFLSLTSYTLLAKEKDHTMQVYQGTLQTGVMAIGGETTGVVLKTSQGSWELVLNDAQKKTISSFHNKEVEIKGTATTLPGVERLDRKAITVESITLKEKGTKP